MTGIIPPLITPLLNADTLDLESLERIADHVISGGVSGLFVLGSTGEGPSLSPTLRRRMIEESCRVARRRVPVLACISDTSLEESAALGEVAAEAGATALVVAPPFYFRYSQEDLTGYLQLLLDRVKLPVYLYNMPGLTKVGFETETVRVLAKDPRVIGLKDSSGDLEYFAATRKAVGGDFAMLIGPEELLAESMRLGATGGVCGGANLHPELFVSIYNAARSGDWAEADRLQARSRAWSEAVYSSGYGGSSYLKGIKAAMAAAGLSRNVMAPPLFALSEPEASEIGRRAAAWAAATAGSDSRGD